MKGLRSKVGELVYWFRSNLYAIFQSKCEDKYPAVYNGVIEAEKFESCRCNFLI